jgi:MFS family permease
VRGGRSKLTEYSEMGALFFLQAMATGMWMVPLSRVLAAHGMPQLRPYAFATSALAAFVSPLIFGAMADRHASPVRVLRWLAFCSAGGMALASWTIGSRLPAGLVLAAIQLYALFVAPTGSIASSIIFSRLTSAQRQFGPVRATATIGWMAGLWIISACNADATTLAGYLGATAWFSLGLFTFLLPNVEPPPSSGKTTFRERMGWDALVLLKNHDNRVIFLVIALFSIPLAAFYPFAPVHLGQLGFERTSALMSLGQVTEVICMFGLARIFGWLRIKWIMAAGLAFGVTRFAFSALNEPAWLLVGVTLHGFSFTLVFVTAQIYLNERIDVAWRTRAQALLSLMSSGFGNLFGYLLTGWWLAAATTNGRTNWPLFWSVLSLAMAAVLTWFLISYHGRSKGLARALPEGALK